MAKKKPTHVKSRRQTGRSTRDRFHFTAHEMKVLLIENSVEINRCTGAPALPELPAHGRFFKRGLNYNTGYRLAMKPMAGPLPRRKKSAAPPPRSTPGRCRCSQPPTSARVCCVTRLK
jgi:hypothetical protein